MNLDLEAIAVRAAAATEGPWTCSGKHVRGVPYEQGGIYIPGRLVLEEGHNVKANCEFIAAAREDIPALLAALRETRAELAAVRLAMVNDQDDDITRMAATDLLGAVKAAREELYEARETISYSTIGLREVTAGRDAALAFVREYRSTRGNLNLPALDRRARALLAKETT